jgi:hypothetical protein
VSSISSLSQEGAYKKAKVVKAVVEGEGEKGGGKDKDPKEWSETQKTAVAQFGEDFATLLEEVKGGMAHIRDNKLDDFVPLHVGAQCDLIIQKLECSKAEVTVQIMQGTPETYNFPTSARLRNIVRNFYHWD